MNPLIAYLKSSKAELEKVTWPSRQDTIRYSTLVITASVIIAVFFGVLDMGLQRIVTLSVSSRTPAAPEQTIPDTGVTAQPDIQVTPVEVESTTPSGEPGNVDVQVDSSIGGSLPRTGGVDIQP